ncbi:hypothetical protein H4S14_001446 [Agrobacterium vitis]|nr:hypothetical protein [Agrobacterium vitis]MBE1437708.1 hypothetical protein [Agrobacterium vitis]
MLKMSDGCKIGRQASNGFGKRQANRTIACLICPEAHEMSSCAFSSGRLFQRLLGK